METSYAVLPDVVIPNGTALSQVFNGVYAYHDAIQLMMYGSDAGYGIDTYQIEVNQDQKATHASTGWVSAVALDNTTILTPPATGLSKHFGLELIGAGSFRVRDISGNVAATRTWKINKIWSWMSSN